MGLKKSLKLAGAMYYDIQKQMRKYKVDIYHQA